MNNPITKSVTVPLSPAEAFDLFTKGINAWWPGSSHSVSASVGGKPRKITFADHKGDDITELTEDGTTVLWGRIIAHDPGAYLAFTWFPGKDGSQATVVTVTFTQTSGGTRADLTHGGFDILGDTADAVSTSYLKGWDMVLGCYCAATQGARVYA